MSRAEREFDRSIRTQLQELGGELAAAEQELRNATNIAAPHRISANLILKDIGTMLEKCEAVVRDHAAGTIRASDETLVEVSHVLGQAHNILNALVDYLDVARKA